MQKTGQSCKKVYNKPKNQEKLPKYQKYAHKTSKKYVTVGKKNPERKHVIP